MEHEVIKDAVLAIMEDELYAQAISNVDSWIERQPQAAERIAKYIQSLLKDKEDGKVHQ